jgi:hypothetical protein
MAFNRDEVAKLLVRCHRRCCICHRFCGFKIETDHITQKADGGSDDIDNAIPLCFECHAETHLYNPRHPRGRKYTPEELRAHRDQWIKLCETSAQSLASVPARIDVGPLQGVVDELEFNQLIALRVDREIGAQLEAAQFDRCVSSGATSLIEDKLKGLIYTAYASIKRANAFVAAMPAFTPGSNAWAEAFNRANAALKQTSPEISAALDDLRKHLSHET